jgi:hypothetical protein
MNFTIIGATLNVPGFDEKARVLARLTPNPLLNEYVFISTFININRAKMDESFIFKKSSDECFIKAVINDIAVALMELV